MIPKQLICIKFGVAYWLALFTILVTLTTTSKAISQKIPLIPPSSETVPTSQNRAFPIRVPFTYDSLTMPLIIVQADVGTGKHFRFALDTGMSIPILIDSWAAAEMGLKPSGKEYFLNPGGAKVKAAPLHELSLHAVGQYKRVAVDPTTAFVGSLVGAAAKHNAMCAASDRIAGFIGLPVLAQFTAQFDFNQHIMSVFPTPSHPTKGSDAITFNLTQGSNSCAYMKLPLAGGPDLNIMLDTGADITYLPAEAIERLAPIAGFLVNRFTAAGSLLTESALVAKFRLGSVELNGVEIGSLGPKEEPSLGLDMLSRFRVTLDITNAQLWLEPTSQTGREVIMGNIGVSLALRNGKYYVSDVRVGSTAQQAGLRTSDELLRCDGRDLKPFAFDFVPPLVNGYAGTEANLAIQRMNGVKANLRIARKGDNDPAAYLRPGFRLVALSRPKSKPSLYVQALLSSSVACQSGIAVGDQLRFVNGISVAGKPLSDVEALLQKPVQTLTVCHAGKAKPQIITFSTIKP